MGQKDPYKYQLPLLVIKLFDILISKCPNPRVHKPLISRRVYFLPFSAP